MNYSSRFFLYAPLAIFLGLAAWAMTYWWVVAGALDKKLTALNGHEAVPGITIAYASKTISGFPFNIDVVFTGLKISGQGAHGPFAWSTEHFAIHRLTYGRAQDIYEAAGNQDLRWTDGDGKAHALAFQSGSLRASAITDVKGLARFDLDVVAASGTDKDGFKFSMGRGQFHLRRDPKTDAIDLMASADELRDMGQIAPVSGGDVRTFGPKMPRFRLYLTLSNGKALHPLLSGKSAWPDAVKNWRQTGGDISQGPFEIVSDGIDAKTTSSHNTQYRFDVLLDPLY